MNSQSYALEKAIKINMSVNELVYSMEHKIHKLENELENRKEVYSQSLEIILTGANRDKIDTVREFADGVVSLCKNTMFRVSACSDESTELMAIPKEQFDNFVEEFIKGLCGGEEDA